MFNRRALAITVILLGIFLFCTFTVLTALASYYAVPSDALLHPYPIDMPPFPADPHVQPEDTTNATWSNFDGFAYHVEPRSDKNETIPRILHWTWKDELLPERWRVVRNACMDMHSDYQHILWTDAMSLDFLKRYYPWFVSTCGFPLSIRISILTPTQSKATLTTYSAQTASDISFSTTTAGLTSTSILAVVAVSIPFSSIPSYSQRLSP